MLAMLLLPPARPAHAGTTIVVDSLVDPPTPTGSCSPTCTLRSALDLAQDGDTITFGVTGTIPLSGTLEIARSVTIQGPASGGIVLDGQGRVQVMRIDADVTAVLSRLTIQHGSAAGGGGILNTGALTVIDSTLSGNSASGSGPLVYGGAINNDGALTVIDSTLSGNSASGIGGAIASNGPMTIVGSTLSGNSARFGSAVGNRAADNVHLRNTIVVNGSSGPNCFGNVVSDGNNLSDTTSCFAGGSQGDIVTGTPGLAPLADNGGPTRTHRLLPGSPAIDAGTPGGCLDAAGQPIAMDQRGLPRVRDGSGDGVSRCDIGAFEADVPRLAVSSGSLTFTEGDPPGRIDPALALSDPGSVSMAGATVTIAGNPASGQDQLGFINQHGITGSLSTDGSMTLTLSGTATVADYQTALRSVTYSNTAHPPASGQRTITFAVQNTDLGTATATRQVIVADVAPTAVADAYSVVANTPLTVAAPGVLANDRDIVGTTLSVTVVTNPLHGTLVLNPSGGFSYAPTNGFAGTDTFTYRASDGSAQSSPAAVTFTVAGIACVPRPRVTPSSTVGNGRLQVHVESTPLNTQQNNPLSRLNFGTFSNARVAINGQSISSGQTYTVPANMVAVDITVERAVPGLAVTVPFTVVDGCGEWKTFVGGGTGVAF